MVMMMTTLMTLMRMMMVMRVACLGEGWFFQRLAACETQ